jgi:hypothetical protein
MKKSLLGIASVIMSVKSMASGMNFTTTTKSTNRLTQTVVH